MLRLICLLILFTAFSCKREESSVTISDTELPEAEIYEFGFPISEFESIEGRVERGDFFTTLLVRLGASQSDAYSLSQASRGVFDLKTIKIGNSYRAFYTKGDEKKLAYLVYEDTKTRFVTFGVHDSISVVVSNRETVRRLRYASATINTSLWSDLAASNLPTILAIRLSDIYSWTIDFFGLQRGDSFYALYEELYAGDSFIGVGAVHYAVFNHGGRSFEAIRFIQDESVQYWSREGENLRKAFLKAPLSFTRVSSGFTHARRHPVTRVVRPHTGVDYAAPTGTEVMSIGDGVVIQRGYVGAGGNTVKIRHNSTYTTAYLHLSRFAKGLTVGKRVRQGEVIGYVGSTGLSTGPHLDFRVWKNGTPINPLKMEAPPADPIKNSNREEFKVHTLNLLKQRDSILSVMYLDTLLYKLGNR